MQHKIKAFTLVEMSLVLLVISMLTGLVLGSSIMVSSFRLANARSLTDSAPMLQIPGLILWLETTSDRSFTVDQPNDGATISTWKDINPQALIKQNAAAGNAPTYIEKGIANLPVLRFNGTSNNLTGAVSLVGNEATVFMVARRSAVRSGTSVFSIYNPANTTNDSTNSTGFVAAYEDTGTILQSFRAGAKSSATHPGNSNAYIFVTKFDGTNNYVYLNGVVQAAVSASGSFSSTNFMVGARYINGAASFYNGDIAEIIVFSRSLLDFERKDIEKYLSKKWKIRIAS